MTDAEASCRMPKHSLKPSLPRRRESRKISSDWIPAFAGMTIQRRGPSC